MTSEHQAWRLAGVAAAIALALAGGAQAQEDGASGGNLSSIELFDGMTPEEGATKVDAAQYASEGPYTIGYAGFGLVNSWRVQAVESTKMLAENLDVDLRITDAGGDPTQQISDTEDLLAQGVDALMISPVAQEPLAPVIERAAGLGTPVLVWGSEAATDRYTAKIVADDHFFGYAGGQKLVEDMGGSGNVIMLRGIAGNSVEQARYEGARAAFEEASGEITIVGEDYGDWPSTRARRSPRPFWPPIRRSTASGPRARR